MSDLLRVNTERSAIEAALGQFRLRVKRGEVVKRVEAEVAMAAQGQRIRDTILAAPSRHAAEIAAREGLEPTVLLTELTRILRAELATLAQPAENIE